MESRSRKILDLVPKNVYKNNAHDHRTVVKEDIVEEAEQAECTSIRQADQPRRGSISSSSSSSSSDSSSGPSFYEDSDDSVKDPNYQIPTPKSTMISESSDDELNENLTESITTNTTVQVQLPIENQTYNSIVHEIPSTSRITPTHDIVASTLTPVTTGIGTGTDPTPTKKGKKRQLNENNWKKNIAKKLRNSGQSYESSITKKNMPKRQLGEPCKETCIYKCRHNISEEQQREILHNYWSLGQIEKQWSFIASCIDEIVPKCRFVKLGPDGNIIPPKRTANNSFSLYCGGNKIRVCKVFFKSTLGINNRPIATALSKKNKNTNISAMLDNRGRHGNQPKVDENVKNEVKIFIDSIPRIESHYTRAHSKRQFIDGSKTIADLHHDYVEICKSKNVPHVNYTMFYRIFTKEFNISFFVPKKDMCDVCEAYKNLSPEEKEVKKDDYEKHHKEKQLSRLEKEADKNDNHLTVSVYDLQAVFQCPKGEISVFYYKSKLNVLNLSVYDLKNNFVNCYVWDEANAHRGVNEIGTCIFKYLEKISNTSNEINVVFYSDNCAGQQKNKFMIAMYLFAVQKFPSIKTISHKYLIKGHTQNEGDSAHSQIEKQVKRELRRGPMYSPDAFISAIQNARKKSEPFEVAELCYEDFYDWKNVCSQMSFVIQKDDENVPVKISDVKILKVMKDDARAIYFKNSYADEHFKRAVVIKKRKEIDNEVRKAYTTKPGISEKKKADLMELINKNLIPRYYRPFYESL